MAHCQLNPILFNVLFDTIRISIFNTHMCVYYTVWQCIAKPYSHLTDFDQTISDYNNVIHFLDQILLKVTILDGAPSKIHGVLWCTMCYDGL